VPTSVGGSDTDSGCTGTTWDSDWVEGQVIVPRSQVRKAYEAWDALIVCQVNVIDTTRSIIQNGKGLVLNTLPALPFWEVVTFFLLFLFGKWLRTSCFSCLESGCVLSALPVWEVVAYSLLPF
jgi:hypothetical protein